MSVFRTARPRALLREGRADWYSIKAQSDGPTAVHIFDEIGYWGVSAQQFIRDLAEVKGPVDIHLNSPGGEVFDGLAIYEALKQRTAPVSVSVDSLAASIASVIAMAADPGQLRIARTASLMIHNGWGLAMGDAADMRKTAELLDSETANIASIYAERSGRPVEHWRGLMDAETWLKGQQAVDAGLADGILAYPDKQAPAMDSWDLSVFARSPQNASVDTGEWDAGKAWANGAKSGDPEAFYRGICAGEKTTGDPGTQAHWALPYRYTPDSAPNAAGVRNAMARLDQTEDLKDKDAVRAKLQRLMKQVNPDYDPGDRVEQDVFASWDASVFRDALKGE